jgi:mRNA-degrading endonuclease RelE of RelBE toxin-antitoxin system
MVFIETSFFSEDIIELLPDDEYAALQHFLICQPEAGDVIRESGGLRKVRWSAGGKGKRGGARIIYYHVVSESQIRMLLIYKKGAADDLTQKQKSLLRAVNERWR